MQYKAFSICLYELEFSRNAMKTEMLENESRRMLQNLYNTLHNKLIQAKAPERFAQMVEGSVFCCCMPEGMVMLNVSVYSGSDVRLRGFLVPQEYLRTVWRLCRVQLLYLCAAGWQKQGAAELTIAEIDALAGAVSISQTQAQKLSRYAEVMLASETPISFALTRFPQSLLPLMFPALQISSAADEYDSLEDLNEINLSSRSEAFHHERLRMEFQSFEGMTLCHTTKRKYPDVYHAKHHYSLERQKKLKTEAKETLQSYPADDVWYFQVILQERHYAALLSASSCEQLAAGCLDFATIYGEMLRFQKMVSKQHAKYLEQQAEKRREMDEQLSGHKQPRYEDEKPSQNSDLPKLRRAEPKPAQKPEEPKKKTSLFKNLFGK